MRSSLSHSPSVRARLARQQRLHFFIAVPLSAMLAVMPAHAQAPVVVAPNSGNTRVYTVGGANGVPVVEINTANAAGLSHNQFTNYNVPSQGLVLNNAAPTQFQVNSQLAGTITTNFNLKNSANVIVNEVVAPNATQIAGFTEIVGGKADLIVANPSGIAVAGAGFINTDRVTLATGKPVFGGNGALTGVRVGSGQLSVSGTGLNGSNLSLLNLLARTVKVEGQVNAQDLLVAAGANDFDYASRTVTANASAASGAAPAYAVDSSALGGMYANKIRLVGTEAGVGVRMLGDVAATTEDLSIDAAGRVQLANKVYAERDVKIAATGGVAVSGPASSVTAKRDVALDAKSADLSLSDGALVAGRDLALTGASLADTSASTPTSANRFGIASTTITTSGAASVSGSSYGAGGALALTAGSIALANNATFYSGAEAGAANRALTLRATTGDLDAGNAQLLAPIALALTADRGAIKVGPSGSGAGLQAGTNLTLSAFNGITNAGNVTAGADLLLRGLNNAAVANVTNSGKLIAGNALTFGAAGSPALALNNAAAGVLGAKTLEVRADSATNAGTLQGTQAVTVAVANTLTNVADAAILTAGEVNRDVTVTAGALSNAGFVQSTGALTLTIGNATTNSGVIATQSAAQGGADGALVLTTGALNNSGTLQSAGTLAAKAGTTTTNSGTIQAVGAAALDVGTRFDQTATGAVLGAAKVDIGSSAGAFALANAGRIQSTQTLALGTAAAPVALTQASGAITLSGATAQVRASTIDNAGLVQSTDALTLEASGAITNQAAGALLTAGAADKNVALTAASLSNAGQIQSTGAIVATTAGATDNSGTILTLDTANGGADRGVTLAAATLKNSGTVQSAATLGVTASASSGTAITNSGKLLATGALTLTSSGGTVDNQKSGVLLTGDAFTLASNALTNAGAIQSAKTLTATITQKLENTADGLILTAGTTPANVTVVAGSLVNAGTLQSSAALAATAGNITNSGVLLATTTGTLKVATALANSGTIQATNALVLTTPQLLDNAATGKILGGANVAVVSGAGGFALTNAGRIQAATTLDLGAASGTAALTNSSTGILYAGTALNVASSTLANAGIARGTSAATLNASGAVTNSGTLATAGQSGALLTINGASLANSGTLQSAGELRTTLGGALSNSATGVILTETGANGSYITSSGTFSNDGIVQSAGAIDLKATTLGTTSFSNTNRIQAAQAITLTAPSQQINTASGNIVAGGAVTITSGDGGFALTNAGNLQAGSSLVIGDNGGRVALTNSGNALAGSSLDLLASGVTNSGTLQSGANAKVNATGAVTNSGNVIVGGTGTVNSGSLTNSGSGRLQTAGALTVSTGGTTNNAGTINAGGSLSVRASDVTNSGIAATNAGLDVTTVGGAATTLTNSGTLQARTNVTLTAANGISNSSSGVISGGGNVTITSGGAGFTLNNAGNVQSGAALSIGKTGDAVALTNQASGVLRADTNLTAIASSINNAGTIQGATGVTLTVAGNFTQTNTGRTLTTAGSDSHIALTAAAITTAGTMQSSGNITAQTPGAITNTGTWLTTGTGAINANGATITNSGVLQSGGTLTLVAQTNITNAATGLIQSGSDLSLTTPVKLTNSGNIIAGRDALVIGGSSAFEILNDGRMQSAQNFTFGSSTARATTTNLATGVIQAGGALAGNVTTLTNNGLVQSGGALNLNATGAIVNTAVGQSTPAQILTVGSTPAALTITAASLTNTPGNVTAAAATIQSSGALTATLSGALNNAGTIATATGGALQAAAATLTNSGTIQSGATTALTATNTSGTTVTNSGTLKSVGNVSIVSPSALTNSGTIDTSGTLTVTGGGAAFGLTNSGAMQATQAITLGQTSARVALTNTATGTIVGNTTLNANASTLANNGTIQSAGALTVDATGAITNIGTGNTTAKILTAGTAPAALTLTGASFTNTAGNTARAVLQSTGTTSLTLSGALTNSGDVLSTDALTVTTGTFTNSGNVQSGATTSLTATNGSGTTVDNSGTLKSTGNVSIVSPSALANSGTIDTSGSLTVTGGGAAFALTNSGAMQAAQAITLGQTGARVALTNTATGTIVGNTTFTANASTLANSNTIQSADALTIDASGAITNTATGNTTAKILNAGATPSAVTISGASFTNTAGNTARAILQSTGTTSLSLSGALTNTGDVLSTSALTVTTGTFTNSGNVQSGATTSLTATNTSGTTVDNSGTLKSAGNVTIVAPSALTNSGTIDTAGTLTVTGGGAAFALTNSGALQATQAITLGQTSARAAVTNEATGTILGNTTFTANASSLTNRGAIQSVGALTIDASGAISNLASGNTTAKILNVGATPSAVTITGASFTNTAGNAGARAVLQSTGTTSLTLTGALTNSGEMLSTDTFTGTVGTANNSGTLQSGNALNLTATGASGTTVTNSGNIVATKDVALVAPSALSNSASGVVSSQTGNVTLTGGSGAFAVQNDGRIDAKQVLGIGTTVARASVTNGASGILSAEGDLTARLGTLTNSGQVQSQGAILLDATGAVTNNAGASVLTLGNTAHSLTLNGASLTNAGTLQSNGALTATLTGASTNSGNIVTTGTGALALTTGTLTNSGAIDSGAALSLETTSTSGTTLTNSGKLLAQGALDVIARSGFDNASAGQLIGAANVTVQGGGAAFSLSNAGRIQAAGTLEVGTSAARVALTNTATGVVLSSGAQTLQASSVSNAGTFQSEGVFTLNATGNITNQSGGKLLTSGSTPRDISLAANAFTNSGTIESTGALGAQVVSGLTNNAGASIVASGNVTLGASGEFNVSNSGRIQAGGALGIGNTTARAVFNNTGVSSVLQSSGALTLYGKALTNDGLMQSGGALTLDTTSITNNSGASILTVGNAAPAMSLTSSAGLTNTGTIQSAGSLTGSHSEIQNTGRILTLASADGGADGALSLTSTSTLVNSGTISSAGKLDLAASTTLANSNLIQAAGAANLTASTFTNAAGARILGDGNVTLKGIGSATGTFLNEGTVSAADTLAIGSSSAPFNLTNQSTGRFQGGNLTLAAGTLTNLGLLQADDAVTITVESGSTLTNGAGAKLLAGGNVSITSALSGGYTLTNAGTLQAGGQLHLGGLLALVTINNNAGAKLLAGTFDIRAGVITNNGTIMGESGGSIIATQLVNDSSSAKLIGASDSGATTIDVSGAVTNKGSIFSNDDLTLKGASITNTGTGGILSSGNLTIQSTGTDITNQSNGAIYSGGKLTLTSARNILNYVDGTIDSDGAFQANATKFYNEGAINILGSGTITAGTFQNVIAGGPLTRTTVGPDMSGELVFTYVTGDPGINGNPLTNKWYVTYHSDDTEHDFGFPDYSYRDIRGVFYKEQKFQRDGQTIDESTLSSATKPLIAAGNLVINGFSSGENIGAVISVAGNLTIAGNSGSSFTNDALALNRERWLYASQWRQKYHTIGTDDWDTFYLDLNGTRRYGTGPGSLDDDNNDDDAPAASAQFVKDNTVSYFSVGSGIRAGHLSVTGVADFNNISTSFVSASTTEKSANGGSGESLATGVSTTTVTHADGSVSVSLNGGDSGASISRVDSTSGTTLNIRGLNSGADSSVTAYVDDTGTVTVSRPLSVDSTASINRSDAGNIRSASLLNARGATSLFGSSVDGGTSAKGVSSPGSSSPLKLGGLFSTGSAGTGSASGLGGGVSGVTFTRITSFSPAETKAFADALKNARVQLGNVSIKLPTNPNGLYVASADPAAKFVVTINQDLGVGADAVGSDFLAQKLGVNPDQIQRRLGDPAYETYLVRQQLVDQLGTKFLAGQKNEAQQMQMLMTNAATEAARLGLQFGQEPTPQQLANLKTDIVWMVEKIIGGQPVLVPQVYLSAKTKGLFDPSGATIAGDTVALDVGNLTNTGGTISGSGSLDVKASGDIKNTSGTIGGGNVSLKAGGSITNETALGGDNSLGKTGTLSSTGTMNLDAGKDLVVKGATIDAKGNATVNAGGNITVDTVVTKTTTGTGADRTDSTKNNASNLNFGGNVKISSGGDTTLAGSNLNVQGNLDTDIKGDFNVLARQDTTTHTTKETQSGLGVGGGLWGSQTTVKSEFDGKNVGSTINVGGNANITAGKTLTLEGSDVNIAGDAKIKAKDVQVLDGKDEHSTTTTTTTTTIGVFTDSGASGNASANRQGLGGKAEAKGQASGELTIGARTSTENKLDYESKSRSSNLNIGGNLKMDVANDVTLRGSNINAGGDVDVNAKNINLLAGQDVKTSTTTTDTKTAGLYLSGSADGEAKAEGNLGRNGEAGAEGNAEVGIGMKTQNNKSTSSSGSSTAKTSGISGKNVSLNAENKITEEGARLNASDTLSLSATTLDSRAAADKTWSSDSSKTDTERVGLYADASASAHAGGVEGTNASASVSAGLKVQYQTDSSANSSSTSTAVTSTYGGKNVVLNVKDKATLEGTKINATENVDVTAGSLDYKAAKNTSTSSSSSDNKNIEAKLGVGAGASASDTGGGEAGYGGTIKGKVGLGGSDSGSSSSTSNVGGISGANINIKTTKGDVNLEGTNIKSTGNTTVDAKGNLNYTAARDTSSSNSSNYNGEIKGELASYNQEISGKGGYNQNNSSSDKAVTGSINTGGNLTLKSGGDTTLEGTQLSSKGDTKVDAGGSVNLKQATSTTSGSGFGVEGEGKLSSDGVMLQADGNYKKSNSSTAQTANINSSGNISITSGKDTNIQGSDINAGKKVDINAGGGLNVTAKEESSSNFKVSGGAGFGAGGVQVDANLGGEKKTTNTGANISGGSGVNLSSGAGGTTLEGTQVKSTGGNVTVTSEGSITQKSANSSTVGGSIGVTFGSATNPGLTDLDLNLDGKTQKTNITAGGGGTVTVQGNTKSGAAIAQKNGTSVPDPKKPEETKKAEEPKKTEKK